QLLRLPPGQLLDPLCGLGRTARRTVAIAVVQRDEEVAGVQAEGREGGTQGIDLRGRYPPVQVPAHVLWFRGRRVVDPAADVQVGVNGQHVTGGHDPRESRDLPPLPADRT